jgi:hypothetical protein
MSAKARLAAAIAALAMLLGAAGGTAAVTANTWGARPAHHAVAVTWGKHAEAANTWG